jgi:hypothetical protein
MGSARVSRAAFGVSPNAPLCLCVSVAKNPYLRLNDFQARLAVMWYIETNSGLTGCHGFAVGNNRDDATEK